MDQTELLLEYLKEHYTQARQHENWQTNATAFLTAAAGAVLGFAFKDGFPRPETWWVGVVVLLIGSANLWINEAHFKGNRFHTAVAGATRRALEEAISPWTVKTPTEIRKETLAEHGLRGPGISIGGKVHKALRVVPVGVIVLGIAVAIGARCVWSP